MWIGDLTCRQQLQRIGKDVSLVRQMVVEDVQSRKRDEILKWLSSYNFEAQQVKKDKAAESGKWFLTSPEFTSWVDGTKSSCLLCHGIRLSL